MSARGLDEACVNLVAALNALPGIRTTGSCCGHGRDRFQIWLSIDDLKSMGARVLARCLSRRYYYYGPPRPPDEEEWAEFDPVAEGWQAFDFFGTVWQVTIADTEDEVTFRLQSAGVMDKPDDLYAPAEALATNLLEYFKELRDRDVDGMAARP